MAGQIVLYCYRCVTCGAIREAYTTHVDRDKSLPCQCGGEMRRVPPPASDVGADKRSRTC